MGDSLIRTVLKGLREKFPHVQPPDRPIARDVHAWAYWNGVADGREQVIRHLALESGEKVPPPPQPEEEAESPDVFSTQDRGSADGYARSSRSSPAGSSG